MSDRSKIEWVRNTDGTAGATWNPVTGCTPVSLGCDHCYARTMAERFRGTPGHYFEHGVDVQLRPGKLDEPLRWKRPRKVFVCSMSDLFHEDVPDALIVDVFAVMARAARHTFQVLTKRHARMRSLLNSQPFRAAVLALYAARWGDAGADAVTWPLLNVWVGVTVEDQKRADLRIPALLETPAAVRFLSCEPLLGPVDLTRYAGRLRGRGGGIGGMAITHVPANDLHWVIAGGESGKDARPMHPDWARSLRDQCQEASIPFLFKQWGEYRSVTDAARGDVWVLGEGSRQPVPWRPGSAGAEAHRWSPYRDALMRRVGKKTTGRELDGRTWDEYPEVRP